MRPLVAWADRIDGGHPMRFEVDGIHHLTLNVTDLERSRAFYTGVLGFVPDQDFPGEKLRYRIGPYTRLVLVPPLPGTPEGDRFSELRVGLGCFGVRSRDGSSCTLSLI